MTGDEQLFGEPMPSKIAIVLDESERALRPCRYCGSRHAYAGPGTAVHAARLICDGCGRFLVWLSFDTASRFNLIERE